MSIITLGTLTLEVDLAGVKPNYKKNTVKHSILGGTLSRRQNVGLDSSQYELKGIFYGTDKETDLQTLRDYFFNNTEIEFTGYTASSVNVRVIEFTELELSCHWDFSILIEETVN